MQVVTPLRPEGQQKVQALFEKLKKGYRAQPNPTAKEREDRLDRLDRMLVKHKDELVAAISDDFSGRSRHESLLADVVLTLDGIREARRHVREWMRRRPVDPSPYFLPSRAYIEPMPKGVVAVISPWNYPVNLALSPTAAALAAGNRVLIKPSEFTPKTAAVLARIVAETFSAEEVAVVEGDGEVARALTHLPLDHILFTGSTQVGRMVARAAAENLVPVTLELGGKSPAIVHPEYDVHRAAERIALGKCFNAGQTCIAPDYALVPEGKEAAFSEAFRSTIQRRWPDLATSEQYTAMATPRGHDRMLSLLEDAKAKGGKVETVAPHGEPKEGRKVAPTLVFGVTEEMRVMSEEIFGPLLPVKTYKSLDEALDYVRAHPRPLALYYFDHDEHRAERTLQGLVSGGACVNDTLVHFAQERLPFGGVGDSGMGAYHGEVGFQTFSHARSVLVSSPLSAARQVLSPPYGKLLDRALGLMTGWVGKLIG